MILFCCFLEYSIANEKLALKWFFGRWILACLVIFIMFFLSLTVYYDKFWLAYALVCVCVCICMCVFILKLSTSSTQRTLLIWFKSLFFWNVVNYYFLKTFPWYLFSEFLLLLTFSFYPSVVLFFHIFNLFISVYSSERFPQFYLPVYSF